MLKKTLLALVCFSALSGCSSEYLIVTSDGSVMTSDGKPQLDKKTGMLEFQDSEGRRQQVKPDTVKSILER